MKGKFLQKLNAFLDRTFCNEKWRCNVCSKEIFSGEYFCDECLKNLPFNDKAICSRCGRSLLQNQDGCLTCNNWLLYLDKSRSVFNYENPINLLIKSAKYDNKKYLLKIFAEYLVELYAKSPFECDAICYVPMTKRAEKKRGYNQSKIMAKIVANKLDLPVLNCIEKTKDTLKQTKLGRKERIKNLRHSFRVDKKLVKGKNVLLIDDVTTTGATAETIAEKLKKGGAKTVNLITVASVPSKDRY